MYPQCLNNLKNKFQTSQGKESYQYMSADSFAGTVPTFTRTQCFRLLFEKILKSAVLSAPVEIEKKLHQHIYEFRMMLVRSLSTAPGLFKWYESY